jgi:REP element-mobilizing transposase RayT
MARSRKKHVQQAFEFRQHGGKRKGAGRPPRGPRSSEPHKTRDKIDGRHPLLVTARVVDGLGSLRRKDVYLALREATLAVAGRADFRIVHVSLQYNHLHLVVEAATKGALSKGMQSFLISAAKRINRVLGRRGKLFPDRYHARALTSPRAVRNAIAYVLGNWRRHREDRAPFAARWKIDPYSSAIDFAGWKELGGSLFRSPPGYQKLATSPPRTWLLRAGWERHGPISVYDTPGPAPAGARRTSAVTNKQITGSPERQAGVVGFCG